MDAYYLSQGDQVTGPFAPEQLLNMWNNGTVTMEAQTCSVGTEDWLPISDTINWIEQTRMPKTQPARPMVAQYPVQPKVDKSKGVAFILSFFLPGLGQLYIGAGWSAILWLFFSVAVAIFTLGIGWLIVGLFSGLAAVLAIEKMNKEATMPEEYHRRKAANKEAFKITVLVTCVVLAGLIIFIAWKASEPSAPATPVQRSASGSSTQNAVSNKGN